MKILDGLWRWTVPHPAWKPEFDRPGGWGRTVASVYAEYEDTLVLIDPLVPDERVEEDRFWQALDRDVARLARPVIVLVGCLDHGRSADAVARRYRKAGCKIRIVGDAAIRDGVSCVLDATFEDVTLPRGLRAIPIWGISPGERAFFLEPWRAAVFADALIGAGDGRVRVAPASWGVKTPEGRETYAREFRLSLRAVLELRPLVLLPSHGEPVLTSGREALEVGLAAPAWGD